MKLFTAIGIALGLSLTAWAQEPTNAVSAQELLHDVLLRLPRDPVELTGQLIVRKWRGTVVGEYGFEMFLHLGAEPALARYTIKDLAGKPLEQLTVTHAEGGGDPVFRYAAGDPLTEGAAPALFAAVQNSDMSWMDLCLAFLWWPGGAIEGLDTIRGRPCYVLGVPAPAHLAADPPPEARVPGAAAPYARVRLWVDQELRMLMQAEGYDAAGRPLRRLWVKSFKKIDERWMIKDLEVQQLPSLHRTKLRVDEVNAEPVP